MNAQSVTLEQITESLIRLRDYSQWMYWDQAGVGCLERNILSHKDRAFSLSVPPDGKIVVTLADNAARIIYDVIITTAPREGVALNHMDFRFTILNKDDLMPDDFELGKELGVFVLSYFQRLLAFTFFARMADVSIQGIAGDLAKAE